MTAKRLDNPAVFVALAILLAAPSAALAQYDGKVWRLPQATAAGARGVQAKPHPQVIVVQPDPYVRHGRVSPRRSGVYQPRSSTMVQRRTSYPPNSGVVVPPAGYAHQTTVLAAQAGVVWVPAVVLRDGRVFANFGYGYEQVYRSCSSAVVVGQPPVIGGNGTVLTPQVPTYTQPVPNQQTSSQQMAANAGRTVFAVPASSTCFSGTATGGVIVYRF